MYEEVRGLSQCMSKAEVYVSVRGSQRSMSVYEKVRCLSQCMMRKSEVYVSV